MPAAFITDLEIPLPALHEQRRIAEVLDLTEALRAKRRAAAERLTQLERAVFYDLFGDPVENSKGWPRASVGDVLTFQQYGPRFYNEAYSPAGVRIVRITDLDESGRLDFDAMPRLDVPPDDVAKYRLQAGDVIFARSGATVGKVALIGADAPVCIAGAYFITMRFDDRVMPEYAHAVLSSPSIRRIVETNSRQAAQQNFSGPGLRALPMPLPPRALQQQFVQDLTRVASLRGRLHESRELTNSLAASLQHRAFRGEL